MRKQLLHLYSKAEQNETHTPRRVYPPTPLARLEAAFAGDLQHLPQLKLAARAQHRNHESRDLGEWQLW